jgi:hypothetical protein
MMQLSPVFKSKVKFPFPNCVLASFLTLFLAQELSA